MADNSPLICRWCTHQSVSFVDYNHFRRHLRVIHGKNFIANEDLVLFERRPGQIRFVENLPTNYPRNWNSRNRSDNVQNESAGMRRSNNEMVVRRNRNPFRNQSSSQMNFNIHEIFGAIGESVSMGIERGVSAAVRIIAEQGIPIKMDHPRDVMPENSPPKTRANTPPNDPIDVIPTSNVEEKISSEKEVLFGFNEKISGEKGHVDMIPIDEVERLLNMARQQSSKNEQMPKLPLKDATMQSDQLVKSTDSLISAEMREELTNNPDFDVFDHVSKETPSQVQNPETYGEKVIDLTTPSTASTSTNVGQKMNTPFKDLKVSLTRLATRKRENEDDRYRLVFPTTSEGEIKKKAK